MELGGHSISKSICCVRKSKNADPDPPKQSMQSVGVFNQQAGNLSFQIYVIDTLLTVTVAERAKPSRKLAHQNRPPPRAIS